MVCLSVCTWEDNSSALWRPWIYPGPEPVLIQAQFLTLWMACIINIMRNERREVRDFGPGLWIWECPAALFIHGRRRRLGSEIIPKTTYFTITEYQITEGLFCTEGQTPMILELTRSFNAFYHTFGIKMLIYDILPFLFLCQHQVQ